MRVSTEGLSKARLTSGTLPDQDYCEGPLNASIDEIVDRALLINDDCDFPGATIDGLQLNTENSSIHGSQYHMAHILFCTYRAYASPYELMLKFLDRRLMCNAMQFRDIINIWIRNYPEDFADMFRRDCNGLCEISDQRSRRFPASLSSAHISNSRSDSDVSNYACNCQHCSIVEVLSSLDESLISSLSTLEEYSNDISAEKGMQMTSDASQSIGSFYSYSNQPMRSIRPERDRVAGSVILAMDSRFVAQQLTAMDIQNIIYLRPYSLLISTKSDPRMRDIVRNFNLLSRHVVVSILNSYNPVDVTLHWITICVNLKELKNFNSLKAIVSGLTNESIHRLRRTIWTRLSKATIDLVKSIEADVGDADNQATLRKIQYKNISSPHTAIIPYLGTFLTDLNFINARYPRYTSGNRTASDVINVERCQKQHEIIQTIDSFRQKIINKLFPNQTHYNSLIFRASPERLPMVSRVFKDWFYYHYVSSMSEKRW